MSPAADSAGQPFEGRSFQPNPFQGDTGSVDPGLEAALHSFTQARAGSDPSVVHEAFAGVIHALKSARLLVPLITEAGDFGVTDGGKIVEKSQELSIVHVEGPDGRAVAPLFSSVLAMSAWNAEARPVPVDSDRAALATAAEGLALMVLDPGSAHSLTLRRGALRAIATGEPYLSPLVDEEVRAAIAAGLEPHRQVVVSFELHSGDLSHTLSGPEVVVLLSLLPGLTAEALSSLLGEVSASWAENAVLQARVDGLGITVTAA
jgi:hypothetical protein